jgi:hypothetical protein
MEGRYHDPKPTMMLMSAALALEYAERSTGNYHAVDNEQMIVLADTRGDAAFLDCVCRNLSMMRYYVEPDGSVFTDNSTQQDRGVMTHLDQYWFQYCFTGKLRVPIRFEICLSPGNREPFTAYVTAFTPVRRTLAFRRIPWVDSLSAGVPPAR